MNENETNLINSNSLEELRDQTIGIDSNVLLASLTTSCRNIWCNPEKFIQEGGSSIDITLQNSLITVMNNLKS